MRDLYQRPTSQDVSVLKEGRDANKNRLEDTVILEFIERGFVSRKLHTHTYYNDFDSESESKFI
jgi:hypothetical protein